MLCNFQMTVNSMVEFFKTEKGVDLEVLTSVTLSKLEEIKEKTATGEKEKDQVAILGFFFKYSEIRILGSRFI